MRPLLVLALIILCFVLASFLAVYSYGRFARQARGKPAHALPLSPDATQLDRLIAPLLAEHAHQSGLLLLASNLDAFAARALSARQAGRSLDLQYYIWEDDGLTGRLLIEEVMKAADRGVRVRLLLDDINLRGNDIASLGLNAHENIEVRLFNPARNRGDRLRRGLEMILRAFRVNRRMHNKAWIADGRIAIVGGRNIGDAYFGAGSPANFRDLDLLLLGRAVAQTERVFDAYWNSAATIPLLRLARRRASDLSRLRRHLESLHGDERVRPYLARVAERASVENLIHARGRLHWSQRARIVWDPPEKAEGSGQKNWLIWALRPLLLSARSQLEIISPYFIPGDAFTRELTGMAERGVSVAILTNSLAATDVAAVHGAYIRCRYPLLRAGIALFELKPYKHRGVISLFGSSSASLHTKSFTVDDHAGFIGSMNFDPRSVSLNCEMGVVFEQPDLVAEVRAIFADETRPQKSYRLAIAENGRLVWQDRGPDGPRVQPHEPAAGLSRRVVSTVISYLPVQSQL